MRLDQVRHLSGPNIYSTAPVSVARLELGELTNAETADYPDFCGHLVELLPGLADHHCAAGRPGGFTAAMARGTFFGHVTEHVALELSAAAGREVHLGRTMWAGQDGHYDVMTECPADEPEDSAVPAELISLAMSVVQDVLAGRRPDLTTHVEALARTVERERLGPSSAAIAEAARRRDIPVRRVGGLSMLRLGYGCHRRMVSAAMTEQTSAIGIDIASDKALTKQFLARAGIPVPEGTIARTEAEAVRAVADLGGAVVVKPRNGNQGRCISVGVQTREEAGHAYRRAAAGSGSAEVIVERYVPGRDYRALVVGGQVAAAAELRPPSVTGDGTHTVIELIDEVNADPRRGPGHCRALTRITVDDALIAHLADDGLLPGSVPAAGRVVPLRRNGNLSTGGTSIDVTACVHQDVAELCRRAAGVTGLDICGIDLRLEDIGAPLFGAALIGEGQPGGSGPAGKPWRQSAAVLEVNACPGLRMHLSPAEGTPRPVAEAVVDRLYPPGATSRIPVISVTGTNGKTSTARMIAHVLRQAGLRTGMSCTDGVFIGGRCVLETDAAGPRSAELVLDDTTVEVAVLETARGGIIRAGLGYDQADVAVVTNITADHLGNQGVDNLDELIEVKALVAERLRRGASVVLNAADQGSAGLAGRPAVLANDPVIRFFSAVPGNRVLERHKRAGGHCYEVCDGQLIETAGGLQRVIMNLAELPGAFGGRARHVVANALASVAACRAAGVTVKDIREALGTFTPAAANPGRGNVYAVAAGPAARAHAGPVLVDYAHNPAALHAIGQMIGAVWPGEPVAAITLPGDRRDDLVSESAQAIASYFRTVVVYEDEDLRGREPGEMRALITASMRALRPGVRVTAADGPAAALRAAVAQAQGSPVLFLYEKLDPALAALDALGATPWPEEDLMGALGEAGTPGEGLEDRAAEGDDAEHAAGRSAVTPAVGPYPLLRIGQNLPGQRGPARQSRAADPGPAAAADVTADTETGQPPG